MLVAGATGFIGGHLTRSLLRRGDEVVAVTRNAARARARVAAGTQVLEWSPPSLDGEWSQVVGTADAIVNLSGEPIADKRWTPSQKQRILDSRVGSTSALVEAIHRSGSAPKVLVNGSAVGFYGSRGDEMLTEESSSGSDFVSQVCRAWEAAGAEATSAGTRVVMIRSAGMVLGADGGALPRLALPFKLFAGGVMGPRDQWVSWIHVEDEVELIQMALQDERLSGPVNSTSPNQVTMQAFSRALGCALKRPVWAPGIPMAMRLALGERADVVFASTRVVPAVAQRAGYEFKHPELDEALQSTFGHDG